MIGFPCIDADSINVFDEKNHTDIGGTLADTFYSFIKHYREKQKTIEKMLKEKSTQKVSKNKLKKVSPK